MSMRELQNSLWEPNSMIFSRRPFFRKLTYMVECRQFAKKRPARKKREFGPKWSFAIPSIALRLLFTCFKHFEQEWINRDRDQGTGDDNVVSCSWQQAVTHSFFGE